MPWTPASFAEKHNHALHGMKAAHASRIANAVLKSGVPEGESIAIANKWAQRHADGGMIHRDDGGSTGTDQYSNIGGMTPSASTMSPGVQNLLTRYGSMSNEQLQELVARVGGSSAYGQMANKVLNQRRMMPNVGQQTKQPQQQQTFQPQQLGQALAANSQNTGMTAQQPQQQMAANGGGLAYGGNPMGMSISMADPWWTRAEARDSGYLNGSTLGRADSLKTSAPSGSYVLPAETLAHLGEGNNMAGARVMQSIISSGPFGTPDERMTHGRGPPRAPSMNEPRQFEAKGGGVQDGPNDHTPVALSHGEMVLSPRDALVVTSNLTGRPVTNLKQAHSLLDHFVEEVKKRHIKTLQKLKPPVGMKKKAA